MGIAQPVVGEIAERGSRIYNERLRQILEPAHNGKFVVIDVDTGEYELDTDHMAASDRACCGQAARRETLRHARGLSHRRAHWRATEGHLPMITGFIHPSGEAVIRVTVRGPHAATLDIQTVLDTGFNDWLMLPRKMVEELGLVLREEMRYTLADGSEVVARIFEAEIEWLGRWRKMLVAEMEGGPLLGMAMLRGCFVSLEVIDGGRVEIRSLIT